MGEQVYMPLDFLSTTPSFSSPIVHNFLSCFECIQSTMISYLTSFRSSPSSGHRESGREGFPEMGGGIVASVEGFREFNAHCCGEKSDISAMTMSAVDCEPQVL